MPDGDGGLPAPLADTPPDAVIAVPPNPVDAAEAVGDLAVMLRDRTVALTGPRQTLRALIGHVTGADPECLVLMPGSFSLAEVGEDWRGVLHLLNWGDCPVEPAPEDACRVYLIRHGQSMVVEDGGQVWSHHPIGLTARGHEQAKRAAERLRDVALAAVYTSGLTRAVETAAHVAEPHRLEPVVDEALQEIALGDFEGMTLAAVHERGDVRYLPWLEVTFKEEFPHEGFHHPADLVFPGGESILGVHERVLRAFHRIVQEHLGETIAIVSHTWTIQPLLAYIAGCDPRHYYRFGLRYATETLVEVAGRGTGKLLKLNADLGLDEVAGGRLQQRKG
ncbi:histidine phosphatase family protein [Georgenia sp. AZ-5]|uniref:histidine phosphatase family protein n=1 Tax=Georgenia sp. AZ-5 TaxID=3367526 RepID=UPI003754D72A